MLIIFAIGVPLYIFGGLAYNWKIKQKALGIESVPNLEFWRDLPALIKVCTTEFLLFFVYLILRVYFLYRLSIICKWCARIHSKGAHESQCYKVRYHVLVQQAYMCNYYKGVILKCSPVCQCGMSYGRPICGFFVQEGFAFTISKLALYRKDLLSPLVNFRVAAVQVLYYYYYFFFFQKQLFSTKIFHFLSLSSNLHYSFTLLIFKFIFPLCCPPFIFLNVIKGAAAAGEQYDELQRLRN